MSPEEIDLLSERKAAVVRDLELFPGASDGWVGKMNEIIIEVERKHRVGVQVQAEAGVGPHRVFALYLYRAIKRMGLKPTLGRNDDGVSIVGL
jgi:hypothetical protein